MSDLGEHAGSFEAELAPLIAPAVGLAAAMLLDAVEAEDAEQQAALRAWRRRRNRRAGTPLAPWFLAIVANQCREVRRGRWAKVLLRADPPEVADRNQGTTAAAMDLRNAVARLPYALRLPLVLRYYLDLPFEEVAAIAGCSVDAAKSRVRRGQAALKEVLAPLEVP
jgi:RNA polymerase sigma-70 factor (ECF subfamily)